MPIILDGTTLRLVKDENAPAKPRGYATKKEALQAIEQEIARQLLAMPAGVPVNPHTLTGMFAPDFLEMATRAPGADTPASAPDRERSLN